MTTSHLHLVTPEESAPDTPLDSAPVHVQLIINALLDRKGFDDWWSSIDRDIQQEIIDDIRDATGGY